MRTLLSWLSLGTLALAGLPAPSDAQPVGEQFQVNTYTTDDQLHPSVASDANGNFVVVWTSYYQDGSRTGVFGQRFDSAGGPLGTEFRVNTYTTNDQLHPSVASDANGNFVVVWTSYYQDGSSTGIFGQRYDSAGETLGTEFRVNSYTRDQQWYSAVASDPGGNFIVVWSSVEQDGVFGQRYDSEGDPQGSEFRVNSYTPGTHQFRPAVASASNGDFVVIWQHSLAGGRNWDVYGQRYDSEGVARGVEFRVNSFGLGDQEFASVASDASGNFVVVWSGAGPDDRVGIYGRRFDSEGMALGTEFRVNSYTTDDQYRPSVTSDAGGNFVVAWYGPGTAGHYNEILGQRYDSGGVAQGGEFQINSYTTRTQEEPSVAAMGTDRFVVTWQSGGQDGSRVGVFAQRFDFGGAQAIAVVSPNSEVRWRIGSLQKIQWAHNLGADATFRIELDRDDDGTFEELIAAAAPVDNAAKGSFAWTVTGPRAGTARVRVSWTDDPGVSDSSDVTFQIRPAGLD